MMSLDTIRDIQLTEAARAARDGKTPLVPWSADELHSAPFLGTYVPAGWRPARWEDFSIAAPRGSDWWGGEGAALFVDSTGIAGRGEPCLTFAEATEFLGRLLDTTADTVGVGIVSAGQFQVYVGLFIQDPSAPGTEVDQSHGLCACGADDGPFDYHECPLKED